MGQSPSKPKSDGNGSFEGIFHAAEYGLLNQLKMFVHSKPIDEVLTIRRHGKTLLHHAVLHHQITCVQFLLELGFDANILDEQGNTPLLEILHHKSPDRVGLEKIIKLLLKYKADINARTFVNRTALLKSIVTRNNVSEILLKYGADPNMPDDDGLLPIHVCATYSDLPLLHKIVAKQANIDAQDNRRRTALYCSVLSGHKEIFDALTHYGCNLNLGSKFGYPLQTAIIKGQLEMVQSLLKNGVNIQCKLKEYRHSYSSMSDYLNLAMLVTHSLITKPDVNSTEEKINCKVEKSLQILEIIIQAMGNVSNIRKNALMKTRPQTFDAMALKPYKCKLEQIFQKLLFIHEMNKNAKPIDGLPKLSADIDKYSLQNVCRVKARKWISMSGTNVLYVVERLHYPSVLKDMLLLKDVV